MLIVVACALLACARATAPLSECAACQNERDELSAVACALRWRDADQVCARAARASAKRLLEGGARASLAADCARQDACSRKPDALYARCALDSRDELAAANGDACRDALKRLARVAVSFGAPSACTQDVAEVTCPRDGPDALFCLQSHMSLLTRDCRREVLRLSELQAEDPALDSRTASACAEDRRRLCPDEGDPYECLLSFKSDRTMSENCKEQLSRRQKLIAQDYRVSRGLSRACREHIKNYHCRKGVSEDKDLRLAQILVCLEGAAKNDSKITTECRAEMMDHRKMLMEDYRLSPEIMKDCAADIESFCTPVQTGGRTIHCLMNHARPSRKKARRIEAVCQRAIENLIKDTDAGEDWRVDPVLRRACGPVVESACGDVQGGEGRVMSCLVEKLGSPSMTEECGAAVIQIQYFVARDFKLDPRLYRACKRDAIDHCNAKKGWNDDTGQMDPERGPLIFPCLYRMVYLNGSNLKLSDSCIREVRRVTRQRAASVDLQPEIEEVCLDDLAYYCYDKTGKGEEILCLQSRLESLGKYCRWAVGNFTEAQAGHVELNPVIMKNCYGAMDKFCAPILKNGRDEGEVMECLITHKNDIFIKSDVNCRAAIEHFQLISLKNYHFTYKFKEYCRSDVMRFCSKAKTKSDVIYCLSETVRNDTISGNRLSVSKDCRQQLRAQLFQQKENIDYDPKVATACAIDLKLHCSKIEHGGSQALECLQNLRQNLTLSCQRAIFSVKRQELTDNSIDYNLITTCGSMIDLFCHNTDQSKVLDCLKMHKEEAQFDMKCKLVVVHRMIDQNSDYRFNPVLQSSCKIDIKKFCSLIIANEPQDKSLQGKVIICLKHKFRESKLSAPCEHQVATVLREQALNYHLDPLLSTMCYKEIHSICKPTDDSDTVADGEVEECLKQAFLHKKIYSEECRTEVATLIGEGRADIQADPLLQRACSGDLLKWCNHLEPGDGRHIKCLQSILTDETRELEPDCRNQLTKRMEMFKSALNIPEDLKHLYDQVVTSPAKRYFLVVFFTFVGVTFIVGMFCGRISRRARYTKRK